MLLERSRLSGEYRALGARHLFGPTQILVSAILHDNCPGQSKREPVQRGKAERLTGMKCLYFGRERALDGSRRDLAPEARSRVGSG